MARGARHARLDILVRRPEAANEILLALGYRADP